MIDHIYTHACTYIPQLLVDKLVHGVLSLPGCLGQKVPHHPLNCSCPVVIVLTAARPPALPTACERA